MTARVVAVVDLLPQERDRLRRLLEQFVELLQGRSDALSDPALARLAPDAYRDDPDAAQQFREVTQTELLDRREQDTRDVLADLTRIDGPGTEDEDEEPLALPLTSAQAAAWIKTLSAVRLVLASRLGIAEQDDHRFGDPRFALYDWIGFRIETLVRQLDD